MDVCHDGMVFSKTTKIDTDAPDWMLWLSEVAQERSEKGYAMWDGGKAVACGKPDHGPLASAGPGTANRVIETEKKMGG